MHTTTSNEKEKKMENQGENDCVSRLIVPFGCFNVSPILDIGIERRRDVHCEIVDLFCCLFLVSTYVYGRTMLL